MNAMIRGGERINIDVLHYIEGARAARGVAVIIDVFRAFSFECYAVHNNVEKIIPVASKELAYELKRQNPEYLLAGERKGIMLPGFDYGNCPTQIEHVDLTNKTIIHTTSAGTQGLENARAADAVLTGSLVNAKAIAHYIKAQRYEQVSLVCMGNDGVRFAEEDDLCARYIKALLEDNDIGDMNERIETLKGTGGKRFFNAAMSDMLPERDFYLCTRLNAFDFVLQFAYDAGGVGYISRV